MPKSGLLSIILEKEPYVLTKPEISKLHTKSEGNINRTKIEKIEQETTENESDLNAVKFWHKYIARHRITNGTEYVKLQAYLNNINGLSATKKYLQLTKQLSLLENQK
jgi:hypothetical protein